MYTLSEIWIYPVKSLGGIRLPEATVQQRGLQHDRRWMIVDENGRFITQRKVHEMALLDVGLDADGLRLWHRHAPEDVLQVPFEPSTPTPLRVTIWDDEVPAVAVSPEADRWLSDKLGRAVRLVLMPESTRRLVDPRYAQAQEVVSFADGYPCLLISQASLDDLNARLPEPLSMKRFRPNLVVTGTLPYAEDQWRTFTVGEVLFQGVKPCARCVLTTIDPDTAATGPEPLRTLATYRKQQNKILFGQNLLPQTLGRLAEGDTVTVAEQGQVPLVPSTP
ncbi:MOSC domain-containing protein [Rhabdobacter roseus]|uniref:MOSC domain-containing protein n=1 Tax=Rhabdobacter roseus TaxID=1655419 RepID=A0A840TS01_9BACT|nr:MOSC domain-containing protein [Rhabdobacter roseus]MBB5284023.1 hypothetical protein [Rhabdobacter roseus]